MLRKFIPIILMTACFTIISLAAVGKEKAFACSCMEFESYTAAMESSSHVLDAIVQSVKHSDGGYYEVNLSVAAAWKGEASTDMQVFTLQSSASCGYHFEIDKRYSVFAYEGKKGLQVSLCSATSLLDDESPIFAELGEPDPVGNGSAKNSGSSGNEQDSSNDGNSNQNVNSGAESASDQFSPDQIKQGASEEELEQRLKDQKSQLTVVFAIVGGLLIVLAILLVFMRMRR